MDESTTTDTSTDSAAVETSTQAADTAADTSAATTANESQTTADSTEAGDSSSSDSTEDGGDDNLSWLTKKGIDPSEPEAMAKVAKMYRDAEKQMHASTAKASELQKALGGDQVPPATAALDIPEEILNHPVMGKLVEEVQQLRAGQTNLNMTTRVNDFFSNNPEAKALESDMAKIVTDNPVIGELVKGGHMAVDALYDMARGRNMDAIKKQGGKEALEQLADKQQAKAPRGRATTKAVNTADDPFLAGFSTTY